MTDHEELDRLMGRIDVSTCDETYRERIREEFSQLMEGGEVEDLNLYAGFFNHGRLADYIPATRWLSTSGPAKSRRRLGTLSSAFTICARPKRRVVSCRPTSHRSMTSGSASPLRCPGSAPSSTCSTGEPKT